MIYTNEIPDRPVGCNLRVAVISDIHMENRKTPTSHIIENLNYYLVNPKVFRELDALFITGDFWDRLVNLPNAGVWEVSEFITRLLRLAKEFSVSVRVLEGTPKHDWKQSVMFTKINRDYGIDADLQYVDKLAIVEDVKLGVTIGYVPDRWRDNVRDTENELKELMATRGYSEVDFMLMHGFCDFQLPRTDSESGFDSNFLNGIVKYAVYIGHDHNAKNQGKIYIPGSFERIRHGENGPRGFIIGDVVDGVITNHRIENERAMPYVTHDLTAATDDDILGVWLDRILSIGQQGYIKIRLDSKTGLRSQVPNWSKLTTADLEVEYLTSDDVEVIDMHFTVADNAPVISSDNIASIIMAEAVPDGIDSGVLEGEIEYIKNQVGGK